MADPTEKLLTTAEAAALEGTNDVDTGVRYPVENENYVTSGIRQQAKVMDIIRLPNALRVCKDGSNPSLSYGVFSGNYTNGADIVTYAGSTGNLLTNNATNKIYFLADVLTVSTSAWPTTAHIRLATVLTGSASAATTTGAYDEVDITDERSSAMFGTTGGTGIQQLISQSLAFGAFTDNLNTTGYIDFTSGTIPAGSIILGWKAVVSTGFTGDTTAVIEVGISGDTDAYSADTAQSVFAAATVGSAPLALEAYVGTAATPRVTVTGGADFGSISAGVMVVTVYYVELK